MRGGAPLKKRAIHQIRIDQDGQVYRHVVVTLTDNVTINEVREDPSILAELQSAQHTRVRRGDRVTLLCGEEMADQCIVTRIDPQGVTLGKPIRMVSFEPEALFEDDRYAVVVNGEGYAVKDKRHDRIEGVTWATARAAEVALHQKYPQKTA